MIYNFLSRHYNIYHFYFLQYYQFFQRNLYFYSYNLELEQEKLYNPEIIIKDNLNIQNKMIRCEMNSNLTFIICFYYSKKKLNCNSVIHQY